MHTISLTPAERDIFRLLPTAVTQDWTVDVEMRTYDDTPMNVRARQVVAHLDSPALTGLRQTLDDVTSLQDMQEALKSIRLEDLPAEDQHEILFVLGPSILGSVIAEALRLAETEKDMRDIADTAAMRGALLDSFLSA